MQIWYNVVQKDWDDNEKTGMRFISVIISNETRYVLRADKNDGVWESSLYPMGYKYSLDDVASLADSMIDSVKIMKFLERPELTTADDVQEFLATLQG
ncbi:hypothetical protein EJP02_083 [Escherichia phage EJP2]|nr:hypothetical protein EJP02_083 [Escherichia phage EJP2]